MLVPHLLKIYFGLGWPSSVLTIKWPSKSIFKKNVKITIEDKQTKKIIQNKNLDCQMDIREMNSDYYKCHTMYTELKNIFSRFHFQDI